MTVKATYKNGVFMPNEPVNLPEGTVANIEFERPESSTKPWMELAGSISRQDADEMRTAVDEAFGKVNPDDWR